MSEKSTRVLICYSNPLDTPHLRLGEEHREIEKIIRENRRPDDSGKASAVTVERLHATRLSDLVHEISRNSYDIIQISGHGDDGCILLNSDADGKSAEVRAEDLANVLRQAKGLRLLILTCCFSSTVADVLSPLVPYLITVEGPANDLAAVMFAKDFYSLYFGGNHHGFEMAVDGAKMLSLHSGSPLKVRLMRRGSLRPGRVVLDVLITGGGVMLLDITAIKDRIRDLPAEEEEFLEAICRSIRAHSVIFETSMNKAALTFGNYVGLFSWANSADPIVCENVFCVDPSISEETLAAFSRLIIRHTDLANSPHRRRQVKNYSGKETELKAALTRFHRAVSHVFSAENGALLRDLGPEIYRNARAMMTPSLELADEAWADNDMEKCIIHLEHALTTWHTLVLGLIPKISRSVAGTTTAAAAA